MGPTGGSVVKNLPANAGDIGDRDSIPLLGRSPGVGNGNPLQYSCLENSWTEEHGRLQFMRSQRVGQNWACMHAWKYLNTSFFDRFMFSFSWIDT